MAERRLQLIALREYAGLTHDKLAEMLNAGTTTISSWERGVRTPKLATQARLAAALGVSLYELQQAFGIDAPVDLDGHRVQPWLTHYESLVLAAGHIAKVDLDLVSHLLQTKEYATVVERSLPGATDEQVADRVSERMKRQRNVYRRTNPVRLVAILSESVLRARVGGPKVMVPQLDYLAEMAGRDNVEVRVMPDDGRSACVASSFELLTKPDDTVPFMAITFDETGAWYHEGIRLDPFTKKWRHVTGITLSPEDSLRRIQDIRSRHR